MRSERLDYLDSLRGLAALIVVFSHLTLTLPDGYVVQSVRAALQSPENLLLYLLSRANTAAPSAVILFFVLSGFVLAMSLARSAGGYFPYILRRFFRIYPVLFFVIILTMLLHAFIGVQYVTSSGWLNKMSDVPFSIPRLAKHLLLWGTSSGRDYDGVIWSLVHEFRLSLIFPLILFSIVRFPLASLALWFGVSLSATCILHSLAGEYVGQVAQSFALSWLDTAYYSFFFAVGALAYCHIEAIRRALRRAPGWLLLLSVVLIVGAFSKTASGRYDGFIRDYICGASAGLLIVIACGWPSLQHMLRKPLPILTGRISYSLYLIHCPIIYVVFQTTTWPVAVQWIAVLAASYAAAYLMAEYIEFPLNRLGKRVSR